MKYFSTFLHAIDPIDGKLKIWRGMSLEADSKEAALKFVQHHGMGFLQIDKEIKPPENINKVRAFPNILPTCLN